MKYIKAIRYSDGAISNVTFFKEDGTFGRYYCTHGSWNAYLSNGQLFFDSKLSKPVGYCKLVFIQSAEQYHKEYKEAFECP